MLRVGVAAFAIMAKGPWVQYEPLLSGLRVWPFTRLCHNLCHCLCHSLYHTFAITFATIFAIPFPKKGFARTSPPPHGLQKKLRLNYLCVNNEKGEDEIDFLCEAADSEGPGEGQAGKEDLTTVHAHMGNYWIQ